MKRISRRCLLRQTSITIRLLEFERFIDLAASLQTKKLCDRLAELRTMEMEQLCDEKANGAICDAARNAPRLNHSMQRVLDECNDVEEALETLLVTIAAADGVDDDLRRKIRGWIARPES